MGKKLDSMLGRNFHASKLTSLVNLAVSRLAVLRHQRQARYSLARSDIAQLLKLGYHDRALLRVEQVIKEQNMLDVFVMMEGYCHSLAERINLIEQQKECPEELKEAISSMIFAATRCGEFPELQEMRAIFMSRFGKEFVARATELRNNCGVNPRMVQKLSTRQPSLENRLKMLKEIASENDIVLQTEEVSSNEKEEKMGTEQEHHQPKPELSTISGGYKAGDNLINFSDEIENMEKGTRQYRDVADAAEAAFKSAAYAAAAARAAVEMSRSESHDPDAHNGPGSGKGKVTDENVAVKSKLQSTRGEISAEESGESKVAMPGLNSDSDEDVLKGTRMPLEKGMNFDENDNGTINEQDGALSSKTHDEGLDMKPSFLTDGGLDSKKSEKVMGDEDLSESGAAKPNQPRKKFRLKSLADWKASLGAWKS